MPAFLIPMLVGAGIGAATNPDDRLKGALLGGTVGALTGGLGTAAAPAAAAPGLGGSAATSALSSATSGLGGAASAEAGKAAAINAASGLAVPTQALGVAAPAATTSLAAPSAGLSTALTSAAPSTVAAPLTGMDKFLSVAKEKPLETSQFAQSMLGGQQQPQQAPVYAAPIQQGGGMPAPPSIEERLAMTGGNEPSFVPRGLFEEERAVLDDEDKLRQLQMQALHGGF